MGYAFNNLERTGHGQVVPAKNYDRNYVLKLALIPKGIAGEVGFRSQATTMTSPVGILVFVIVPALWAHDNITTLFSILCTFFPMDEYH